MRSPLLTLVLLLSLAPTIHADCFCLTDEDDTVWFDCVEQKRPLKVHPLYFCRVGESIERSEVQKGHTWQRVAAGEGVCQPCRQMGRGANQPRSMEEDEKDEKDEEDEEEASQ